MITLKTNPTLVLSIADLKNENIPKFLFQLCLVVIKGPLFTVAHVSGVSENFPSSVVFSNNVYNKFVILQVKNQV